MKFTGTNLKLVEYGLQCALEETNNMIVTAPEEAEGSVELREYRRREALLLKLLANVDLALFREAQPK